MNDLGKYDEDYEREGKEGCLGAERIYGESSAVLTRNLPTRCYVA